MQQIPREDQNQYFLTFLSHLWHSALNPFIPTEDLNIKKLNIYQKYS